MAGKQAASGGVSKSSSGGGGGASKSSGGGGVSKTHGGNTGKGSSKSGGSAGGAGGYKMSFNDCLSYGFKYGESWSEDKRAIEKAFNDADRQNANKK